MSTQKRKGKGKEGGDIHLNMSNDSLLFDGYMLQLYTHQTKIQKKKKFFALKTVYKEDNILVQHA
jgi:hypothetical protein